MLQIALYALIKFVVVFAGAMTLGGLLVWAERKQSAVMQDRIGPNRANLGPFRLWGLVHLIADALKMMNKEDTIPAGAHRALFKLAPVLAIAPVFIVFSIIPFGPTLYGGHLGTVLDPTALPAGGEALQVFRPEFGLLFYFAVASLANYGATIAGWASYNKYSLLGGLRTSSQMLSYEVAMGLAILGMFLVTGTLEPGAIVDWQGPNPLHWGIVVQPVAFVLFFVAVVAETKRAPFDLPEGESEIIGYFVEYSGLRFAMFMLGEFVEIVFAGAILTTVFFGGYHFPGLFPDGFHIGGLDWQLPHLAVVIIQLVTFGAKLVFLCWFQMMVRWTLPRFRPDQLMALGWKKLLPVSLANVMGTAAVLLWLRSK